MEKHWIIFDQTNKKYFAGHPKKSPDVFIWSDNIKEAYFFEHEISALITIKARGFGWLTLIEIYKSL